MNSTQGVLEACYKLFMDIAEKQKYSYIDSNPQLSHYAKEQLAGYVNADLQTAGAEYVALLSISVNDYIKRPGMVEDLLHRPHIFPPLLAEDLRGYAVMDTDTFAQRLYDICTDNGSKLTNADDEKNGNKSPQKVERCLYAAYVYAQVETYLEKRSLEIDAISVGNGRQLSITNKHYQYALTTRKNKYAYIEVLTGGIMNNLRISESGELEIGPDDEKRLKAAAKGRADAEGFSVSLIQQVFTAVYRAQESIGPEGITVYMPKFCREMGIDISKGNANDIWGKLKVFEECLGVLEGSKRYAVLNISAIDPEANTITIAAPYMYRLLRAIKEDPATKVVRKSYSYEIAGYSWLIHSTIVSNRNEAAKQIVNRIIAGLIQRGGKADSKLAQNKDKQNVGSIVTYSVSFATIVHDVPILESRIAAGTTADKNKKLKRAFTGAYELLKKETDAYKYFIGLTIPEHVPTMTTLKNDLVITYQGINAAYSPDRI